MDGHCVGIPVLDSGDLPAMYPVAYPLRGCAGVQDKGVVAPTRVLATVLAPFNLALEEQKRYKRCDCDRKRMKPHDNMNAVADYHLGRKGLILAIVFAPCLIVVVAIVLWVRADQQEQLRICCIELTWALNYWNEKGRPESESLLEFMRDYPADRLCLSNRTFVINGSNVVTKFASTRLSTKTLFITTNGVVILLDEKSGDATSVSIEH